MQFNDADRARIAEAIAAAERGTAGEIVVIIANRPHRHMATALSVAVLAALALPLLALLAGWSPASLLADWADVDATTRMARAVEALVAAQAVTFLAVLALLLLTPLHRLLTPKGLRHDRVHRDAVTQFRARGLDRTAGRTGVLLYVDAPEHIAEVVADSGIFTKVAADDWHDTIRLLIDGASAGRPADGLVAAIAKAGALLATHVPPVPTDVNELPNALIEI
jgi:putative membrane protein